MNLRFFCSCTMVAALISPDVLIGQSPAAGQSKKWVVPRTEYGQPDLQGVWTNASRVPLERPKALGSREFYTKQEAEENAKKGARGDRPASYAVTQYDLTQYGLQTGQEPLAPSLRTSLIVGPEGRIPPMTLEAQRRVAEATAYNKLHAFDGPEDRSLSERCILWPDEGPPMLPGGYNNNMEIVQGPKSVAILNETIHDTRVIPLDGRPHLPSNMRFWRGDPRGHWDGDTLVIDSTNFTDKISFHGANKNLHVIERLTRIAPTLIRYQFTVEDPTTWVRPWSGEVMMARINSPIFEYACQEGNYGMPDILAGARAEEKRQAEKKGAVK